jgi:cytochrome c553
MGENFAGLQTILAALITSNYAAVPAPVEVIQEHAAQLTRMVPKSAEGDRDRFLAYAYNLGANASDLNKIAKHLVEMDAAQARKGAIATNELREAAAAHYGGMVTMCVACHNRFRVTLAP